MPASPQALLTAYALGKLSRGDCEGAHDQRPLTSSRDAFERPEIFPKPIQKTSVSTGKIGPE